jgi:transposase
MPVYSLRSRNRASFRCKVVEALAKGMSYRAAAAAAGTSLGTVQRIAAARPFDEPAAA